MHLVCSTYQKARRHGVYTAHRCELFDCASSATSAHVNTPSEYIGVSPAIAGQNIDIKYELSFFFRTSFRNFFYFLKLATKTSCKLTLGGRLFSPPQSCLPRVKLERDQQHMRQLFNTEIDCICTRARLNYAEWNVFGATAAWSYCQVQRSVQLARTRARNPCLRLFKLTNRKTNTWLVNSNYANEGLRTVLLANCTLRCTGL